MIELHVQDGKCSIDGVSGTCVSIANCTSALLDLVEKKKPQVCSYAGTEPVVCCKDRIVPTAVKKENMKQSDEENQCGQLPRPIAAPNIALKKCIEYRRRLLSPCEYHNSTGKWRYRELCKLPGESLVVGAGGKDAERNDYRHMALLLFGAGSTDQFCGGSVLSEWFILTAAHCTSNSLQEPVTIAVTGILRISDPQELWRRNKIQTAIPHPDYHSPDKYHDIALLKTETDIKLDHIVVPICLHTGEESPPIIADDWHVYATGWGALGHHKPLADTLQTVPLVPSSKCRSEYAPWRLMERGFDESTQICYGDDGRVRDTCQGDSGGPVQVSIGRCVYSVVGITSFGKECGTVGVPAVYTRVRFYWRWVVGIVWP